MEARRNSINSKSVSQCLSGARLVLETAMIPAVFP
jgi:hypothetical protein